MDASELRRHIMLVESYNRDISEVDATRRGLFKSAAALAAVAALPQQSKQQAVELIKDRGPELMQVVLDAIKYNITKDDIDYVEEFGQQYYGEGEDPHPLDIFPENKQAAAAMHITGWNPNTHPDMYTTPYDPDEDAGDPGDDDDEYRDIDTRSPVQKRVDEILGGLDEDQKMELLRKTWQAVGLGNDPGWYHYYDMWKRYPETMRNMEHTAGFWKLLQDFMPQQGQGHGTSHGHEGLEFMKDRLAKMKNRLATERNPYSRQWAQDQIEKLEKMIRDHVTVGRMMGQSAAATRSSASPTGQSPASTGQRLSPVLSAVDTILKAFKRADKVSNAALEVLKDINPADIKVTMQRDAGQEPATPQQPAALPAPTPGIDLGLDRQKQAVNIPKES